MFITTILSIAILLLPNSKKDKPLEACGFQMGMQRTKVEKIIKAKNWKQDPEVHKQVWNYTGENIKYAGIQWDAVLLDFAFTDTTGDSNRPTDTLNYISFEKKITNFYAASDFIESLSNRLVQIYGKLDTPPLTFPLKSNDISYNIGHWFCSNGYTGLVTSYATQKNNIISLYLTLTTDTIVYELCREKQ